MRITNIELAVLPAGLSAAVYWSGCPRLSPGPAAAAPVSDTRSWRTETNRNMVTPAL